MIWRTLWSRSRVHDSSASDPPRSKFNLHVGSITETANATPTAQSCRDFRTPINDIREAQLSATSIGTGDYFRSSIASIDPKWPVWSPYRAKYKRSFAHQCGNWLAVLARQEELSLPCCKKGLCRSLLQHWRCSVRITAISAVRRSVEPAPVGRPFHTTYLWSGRRL